MGTIGAEGVQWPAGKQDCAPPWQIDSWQEAAVEHRESSLVCNDVDGWDESKRGRSIGGSEGGNITADSLCTAEADTAL